MIVAFIASCVLGLFVQTPTTSPSTIPAPIELEQRDALVFDAVVAAVRSYPNMPFTKKHKGQKIMVLKTLVPKGRYSNSIRSKDGDIEVSSDLVTAAKEKNNRESRLGFEGWSPADSEVFFGALPEDVGYFLSLKFFADYPEAKCYVSFALPGFSVDGNSTLVYVELGPSSHGADAMAILERADDTTWKVKHIDMRYGR